MLKGIQAEKDNKRIEVEIDHDVFLTCITNRKEFLESVYKAATSIEGHRYDDQMAHGSLPRQRIWTRSFATKRECIDNLIGLWKDCWRLKKPAKMRLASRRNVLLQPRNCKNEANKSCIFNM